MNQRARPAARRARLRERLTAEELDALVVGAAPNITYLSGFTGSNGRLVVAEDPEMDLLVTDGRYATQAAQECPGLAVLVRREGLVEAVAEHLAPVGGRVGFEAARTTWRDGEALREAVADRGMEAVPTAGWVEALRAVKDDSELAALRAAGELTVAAWRALLETLRPGMTERDVAIRVERSMVDLGAAGPAFPTIVAGGPNGARPHHRPGDRPLAAGELVTVDMGARLSGYCADMTRTVALGQPPAELRAVHELVRTAQGAGVGAAVAGQDAGTVDAACRDAITAAGYGDRFVHDTGHGVGLEVHEQPDVRESSTDRLQARMTITVEPGVYLPGSGGVRIEDTVAVTDDGPPACLTETPRTLLVL